MLARRLRRQPNIEPALGQCIVFAGLSFFICFIIVKQITAIGNETCV